MAAYVNNNLDTVTEEYVTESTPFLRNSADVDCVAQIRSTGPSDFTISSLSYYDPYHDSTYAAQYLIPLKQLHESSYLPQAEDNGGSKSSCKAPVVTPGAVHTLHRPGNQGQNSYVGTVNTYSVPAGTPTPPPLYSKPPHNHTNKPHIHVTGADSPTTDSYSHKSGCQETCLSDSSTCLPDNQHQTRVSQSPEVPYRDPVNGSKVDPLSSVIQCLNPSWKVDYLDFTPKLSGYDNGTITCVEGFPDQIKKANAWLRQNPHADVLTCETLTWSSASLQHVGDSESMVLERAHNMLPGGDTYHVMGVRVWLVPKQIPSPPQTLSYRDYKATDEDKLCQILQKANTNLEERPLPGKLVSFETVMVPNFRGWDSNQVIWQESYNSQEMYQVFLRLFYVEGPTRNYKLGIRDIVPEVVHGNHEPFSCLMRRASQWVSAEKNVQVTNLRSTYLSRDNGAKIFSLECVVTPLIPTQPNHTLPEVTYWTQALTSSTETTRKKFLIHIRIYIDGEFLDPDPRLLPPLPYSLTRELQNSIEEKEIKRFYKKKKMRRTQNRIAIATFLFILVTVAIVIIIERMLKKYYL